MLYNNYYLNTLFQQNSFFILRCFFCYHWPYVSRQLKMLLLELEKRIEIQNRHFITIFFTLAITSFLSISIFHYFYNLGVPFSMQTVVTNLRRSTRKRRISVNLEDYTDSSGTDDNDLMVWFYSTFVSIIIKIL